MANNVPSTLKFSKKSDNGEFYYESNIDKTRYLMKELNRAALKDVGRFILRVVAREVRAISPYTKKARYAPKRYQMWVRKQEGYLDVGIENTKFGAESAWWADQAELGTAKQPKRGILRSAVYDNIDKIREIEAHYIQSIDDELAAEALIDEEETQEAAEE